MSSREALIGNDFQGLIDAAVNAELMNFPSTKKQYWKQIGDALSYAGYPKTELGDEVAERIEARFFEVHGYSVSVRTAHYYDCKKEWDGSGAKDCRATTRRDESTRKGYI